MTTTTVEQFDSLRSGARRSSQDVYQQLSALVSQCRSVSAFYRAALELCAEHLHAHFAAMNLCNAAGALDESVAIGESSREVWLQLTQDILLESQADGVALARLYDIDGTGSRVAMLVVPLRDERKYRGAMAFIVNCLDRAHAELLLFELRSFAALACASASGFRSAHEQTLETDGVARALARAARFGSVTELAFAITNGLKTKFHCDQVVLGKVQRSRVQPISLSGMDALYPRSPGTRLIRQAMEECLDFGRTIYSKPGNDWSASEGKRDHRLHRQWRSAIGDAAVASVPLLVDDCCVAILSLVRPGNVGFRSEELDDIAKLASAYAPALQLVARASRSWIAQTRDALREGVLWLMARNRWGRRVTAAALVALVVWLCLGTWDYRLSTPCQLTPTRLHHCVAPYDGSIQAAYIEVGDHVKAGQLLVAMDTRELELELRELQSEAAVLQLEVNQAAARQQLEAAAMARARLQVTLARLAGVRQRIDIAQIRAPADGTIMTGDVQRRVGEVVRLGEPLLEFAPYGSWAVELHVNSRDAQQVAAGQRGRFVTFAQPDQAIECQVQRIDPEAVVTNGQAVYVAHAQVIGQTAWSLAGMDGVATLDIGPRPVWWVVLHRAVDFVRLHFWV